MFTKQKVAVVVAEFLGAALWALTVLAIATSQIGLAYFVALGTGLALLLLTVTLGYFSKGFFNPAITVGLWTIRKIPTKSALAFIVAQLLGGLAAFALYQYLRGGDYSWGNNAGGYDGRVLVAEVVGTAVLAFGIAATIYQGLVGGMRAAVIGASLTVGVFIASIASLGLVNPAVAFATERFEWTTYVLGPVLGAIIGFNLYNLLFSAATAPVAKKTKAVRTVETTKVQPVVKKTAAVAAKKPAVKKASTKKK